MPTLISPPKLLDSSGAPATGHIVARVTGQFASGSDLVLPVGSKGIVRNGEILNATGTEPFALPVTPVGAAVELVLSLDEWTAPNRMQKVTSGRTVSVPDQATVTWDELIDVVPVLPSGDYVVPPWVGDLLTAKDDAESAAGTAVDAATDAEVARVAAVAAKVAAESVPTTTDALMASVAADSDSDFATGLSTTIGTAVVSGTQPVFGVAQLGRASGLTALNAALAYGVSCSLQLLSDSTGALAANDPANDRWIGRVTRSLADAHPTHRVEAQTWNDTKQDYDAPVVYSAGPSGDRKAVFSGAASGTIAMFDTPENSITGDHDLKGKVALANWSPATENVIAAKYGAAGNRGWYIGINGAVSGGRPFLTWTSDGTTNITATCPAAWVVPANNATVWLRVFLDVDNGAGNCAVSWYTSADEGNTWTQIGATTTPGPVTSVFDSTSELQLGARGGLAGAGSYLNGSIYRIEIRNGFGGETVAPILPEMWDRRASTTAVTYAGSPVLHITNGSKSGADIPYLNDSARLKKMSQRWRPSAVIISCGHNDSWGVGPSKLAEYDTLLAGIRARFPTSDVILCTQNPETSVFQFYQEHAVRQAALVSWAARNGLGVLDVFRAFTSQPNYATLIMVDGIHPTLGNGGGADLWARTFMRSLDAA